MYHQALELFVLNSISEIMSSSSNICYFIFNIIIYRHITYIYIILINLRSQNVAAGPKGGALARDPNIPVLVLYIYKLLQPTYY